MSLKLLLIVLGGLLAYTAGTWAWIFFKVIRQGSLTLVEHNLIILHSEFILAVTLALFGLAAMVFGAVKGIGK